MRACRSVTTADFFAHNGSRSISWYACTRRRARHAIARARTTGVRVDNGCRYHLVFTAGRRKGGVYGRCTCALHGAASCFIPVFRFAAWQLLLNLLLLLFPSSHLATAFPLGRTHMPLGSTGLPFSLFFKYLPPFALLPSTLNRHKKSNIKFKNCEELDLMGHWTE